MARTCCSDTRPARFIRLEKAVSIPDKTIVNLSAAAFGATRCSGSGGSPAAPSTGAAASTGATAVASVQVSVNPNPVPFSGAPITDAPECAGYAFTWFYDTVMQESAGRDVTFTSRVDLFDGKTANTINGLKIVLGPNGTTTLRTRWCSGASTAHTAQSIFGGVDANGNAVTATGQIAQLVARGK